jgi:hypothetical protein
MIVATTTFDVVDPVANAIASCGIGDLLGLLLGSDCGVGSDMHDLCHGGHAKD